MKAFAAYIMRGRLQAAAITSLFGFLTWILPLASYVSGAAVGLVALRRGPAEGLRTGTIALVATAVLAWAGFGSPLPAVGLAFALWLPVCLGALVLRLTEGQGAMALAFGTVAAAVAVGAELAVPDLHGHWLAWLQRMPQLTAPESAMRLSEADLEGLARLMSAIVAAAVTASLTVTVLIARWWQALLYNPGGFRAEFRRFRLPGGMLTPAMAVLALLWMQLGGGARGDPATALAFVLGTLFVFQGLAVAHERVAAWGLAAGWLVGLYALLVLLTHYTLLALAVTGVADGLADFRRPRAPPPAP